MMENRKIQAALKIALIQEEFSKNEIIEAVTLLKQGEFPSNLLSYLSEQNAENNSKNESSQRKKDKDKFSGSVQVREQSPEKDETLSKIESLLAKKTILRDAKEIQIFYEETIKDFIVKGSRQTMIKNLIKFLSGQSTKELKVILEKLTLLSTNEVSDYAKLANFIITGEPNPNQQNNE